MPTEQPDGNIRDLKDFKDIQRACCKAILLSLVAHKGPAENIKEIILRVCHCFALSFAALGLSRQSHQQEQEYR